MTTAIEPVAGPIPRLRDGDRLTRAEFVRRYEAMPPGPKAELIDGVVHMASPISGGFHGVPHGAVIGWLRTYVRHTRGTQAASDSSLRIDDTNEPQPDACLRILPAYGGQTSDDPGAFFRGVTELVVEVSNRTAAVDLGRKLRMYERAGAPEYLVWVVRDEAFLWFALGPAGYEPIPEDADGSIRSRVFPGLWLDTAAMVADDIARIDAAVEAGCRTPDHAAFVARLAAARTQGD